MNDSARTAGVGHAPRVVEHAERTKEEPSTVANSVRALLVLRLELKAVQRHHSARQVVEVPIEMPLIDANCCAAAMQET